jgi:hypothetical protein
MEIFDDKGKSQIDNKVIRRVFLTYYRRIIIAFTDKTYIVLPTHEAFKALYPPDPISRDSVVSELSNPPGRDFPLAIEQHNAHVQELIEAGIYSKEEIEVMRTEAEKQFNDELVKRITSLQKELTRLENIYLKGA